MNFTDEGFAHFAIAFPFCQQSLLFWVFATFVVHICQRLVEQAASAIDTPSRQLSVSQSAMCIGCLVWALDVVGFYMYPGLAQEGLKLAPALGALIIMTVSARITVPQLSRGSSARNVGLAGLGLAVGMVLGHVSVVAGYAHGALNVNPFAVCLSIALAISIAVLIALRHRAARLNAVRAEFRPLKWRDKVIAGAAIVPLHWFLINIFPLPVTAAHQNAESVTLLITLLVFGLAVAVDQLQNLRYEQARQYFLNRALSLVRASPRVSEPQADMQLSLIADRLPTLISPESLTVYFQPIVTSPGAVRQQEALLRITDEILGPISPETFFLACELQGKTEAVDRMIITIALDHVCAWQDQGMGRTQISVNVAPGTLVESDFATWLELQLYMRGLPPETLKLEMTEHAIIACGEKMVSAMTTLKTCGIGVIMDDFGAGYSSLGVLAELPIEGIKCDRLFVKDLHQDLRRQVLLRHIASLARELGLSVTAEGIENREELAIVMAAGIRSFQGYLFARALPASEIPHWHGRNLAHEHLQTLPPGVMQPAA